MSGEHADDCPTSTPRVTTVRCLGGLNGVIDPLDTRRILAMGIEAAICAPIPETKFGVFRM